jgi:hypothetical protein
MARGATARKWLEALDDDHLSFDEMSRYADGLCADDERSAIALHMGRLPDLS